MSNEDFYQRIRQRIKNWAGEEGKDHPYLKYILVAPDLFHLLCRLMVDERVPARERRKLAAIIAYFISPIDILPEAILGPIGYLDDVALAAYGLKSLLSSTDEAVLQEHWAGDDDLLLLLDNIIVLADKMIGEGPLKKLKQRFLRL
jgi:uncharacterized membrane protein YkvA (DUF1232 family)